MQHLNSMPRNLQLRFILWSKTREYRWRVRQACRFISEWLQKVVNPYIAFSGGKDSTCILHLTRDQMPDIPAVYFDAENAFPECYDLLERTRNVIMYSTDEPFLDTLSRFGLDEHRKLDKATMQSTVYGPIRRLVDEYNFNGVCYGLRKEESYGRRMNALVRGSVFQYKRDGLWACQPIMNWSYNDVWAYIVSNELEYCRTYDKMWDMPEEDQRISYWAGETKRTYGRWAWLKRNYLGLFNKLAQVYPDVRNFV